MSQDRDLHLCVVSFLLFTLFKEHQISASCEIPVLRLVIATHVRTPQLLNQDPNDADEQDKVHLGDSDKITEMSEQLKRVSSPKR